MNELPEMKPIPGCPGYFATREGSIYSNKHGKLRKRSTAGIQIRLSFDGVNKSFTVATLVKKTWKDAPKDTRVQLIHPKHNWRAQDADGHFI